MDQKPDSYLHTEFTRRRLLLGGAATLTVLAGSRWLFSSIDSGLFSSPAPGTRETLMITHSHKDVNENARVVVSPPGALRGLYVASKQPFSLEMPFFGHTVTQHPKHPHLVYTFEKWGKRGALVDLHAQEILKQVTAEENYIFFGHAAFIRDSSVIVTSEDTYARNGGQLVIRDPDTLKPIGKIATQGTKPHECVALENEKILLVANEGPFGDIDNADPKYAPHVAWLETASGKLLHKVNTGFKVSHVKQSPDGWILAGGFARPSQTKRNVPLDQQGHKVSRVARASLISPQGKLIALPTYADNGDELAGEALSMAFFGNSGLVAYTIPDADRVYFWHYRTQQMAGWLALPRARGVVVDLTAPDTRPTVFVSTKHATMAKVTLPKDSSTPVSESVNEGFGGSGSHMVRLYV